jgi:hypothetical protein
VIAEDDGKAAHAFAANQPDLDAFAVGLNGDDGCESAFWEINGVNGLVQLFERHSQPEVHRFELRLQQSQVVGRKGCEQSVIIVAKYGICDVAFLRDRLLREIVHDPGEWPAALVHSAQSGAL